MEAPEKIKARWTRCYLTAVERRNEDEKYICNICEKDLGNPSNLALHANTHVIERKFKCQPCQIPFKTQSDLEKHLRSSLHETRSAKTEAFGVPTMENPRPFRCPYCDVKYFTKHGHLAKHLRSKLHIQRLETLGLIPEGTWALMDSKDDAQRFLQNCINTQNSESAIESIRTIFECLQEPDWRYSLEKKFTLVGYHPRRVELV